MTEIIKSINNTNKTTMGLEMNDLIALRNLDHGMSPYEQVKVANMQNKRAGGTAIAGLVIASAAAIAAVGGWIYAGTKANAAERVALAHNAGTSALLNQTAGLLATERAERVQGDINVTVRQSGTQANFVETNALSTATAQVLTGLMTGQYSQNPQAVTLYSAPKPCGCPCSCGC